MSESSVSTLSPEVSSVRYLCRSLWQLPGHRPVCLGQGHELKVKSAIRHCCRGQVLQHRGCNVTPKPAVPAMWRPVYCATLLHGHPFWLLVCHCQSSPLAHGQSSSLPVFQTQHIGTRFKVSLTTSSLTVLSHSQLSHSGMARGTMPNDTEH